jgi:hypothetical protein
MQTPANKFIFDIRCLKHLFPDLSSFWVDLSQAGEIKDIRTALSLSKSAAR